MDKKYLILAILAVCVIAGCVAWFGFYDNSKKALAEDVSAFDRGCPVEMAPGSVIRSVAYDAGTNSVNMQIEVSRAEAANAADKDRHTDKVTLLFQAPEYRHLLKDMVKAKASLTLGYVAAEGTPVNAEFPAVVLSTEEMAAIEHRPLLSGKERALISMTNRVLMSGMCPVEWGDGATLVNAALDMEPRLLILYIRSEKIGSPEYQVKLFKSELKANRHRDTMTVRDLVKELAATGYGIKVCYVGDDMTTVESEIEIPTRDIYNISQLQ